MEVISSIYNSGYNIKKFYLGSRELNLAYLGNQVIYDEVIGDNDLNYILYEFYGSDTLPNTVEAPVKRAILKGNTLSSNPLSVLGKVSATINDDNSVTMNADGDWHHIDYESSNYIGNKATFVVLFSENTTGDDLSYFQFGGFNVENKVINTNSFKYYGTITGSRLRFGLNTSAKSGSVTFRVMLLDGDYSNHDIPYPFGIQSVKMPVLTTTGKNLFDESKHTSLLESSMVDGKEAFKFETGFAITSKSTIVSNKTFEFKENTQYTIRVIHKASGNSDFMCIRFFYSDGSDSAGGVKRDTDWTEYFFSSSANKTITAITNDSGGSPGRIDYIMKGELGLFEGIATSYEPYKSNILTVNEDVTLRGIGDVKDELNLLTGEITQRIVEVVLDGSEDWFAEDDRFTLEGVENFLPNRWSLLLSDKYPSYSSLHSITQYPSYIMGNGWAQGFHIRDVALFPNPKNQLSEFKEYLSQNPVTVQYQSATESIKTVDLTIVDQDGKTINKLNSFNGTTHVSTDVAENSAYPMVSLEVASELQAAMSKVTEDIELIKPVQNDIETTIDTQSNDIDSLLLATTELFEMFL